MDDFHFRMNSSCVMKKDDIDFHHLFVRSRRAGTDSVNFVSDHDLTTPLRSESSMPETDQ